jgi:large subunit ribosomal protein L10
VSRRTLLEKRDEVKEIKDLIQQHQIIGVASLQKVRTSQLQELKKKLEDNAYMRVIKNNLMKRAIDECEDKPGIEKLKKHVAGSNIFLFSKLGVFNLVILLMKSKMKATAKAGDLASYDVVVPAGNTGLPPGPIISQLGSVGLPTRIETGSVWINRDTTVVKNGEVITASLASVLSKLGIKPVQIGLTMNAAYDNGLLIAGEELILDLEDTMRSLVEAHASSFNLSLNITYPLPENISFLFQAAHKEAYTLALNAAVFNRETITDLLRKANSEMLSVLSKTSEEKLDS